MLNWKISRERLCFSFLRKEHSLVGIIINHLQNEQDVLRKILGIILQYITEKINKLM